jgi:hypothetical protein
VSSDVPGGVSSLLQVASSGVGATSPRPAGYSGTPQLRKLGIAAGVHLAVVNRPPGWEFAEPLPTGVVRESSNRASPADVVLAFTTEPTQLASLLEWGERVFPVGAVWVAWPRKAGGHVSEMTEGIIRDEALVLGLVDVKVAAIDDDWSGLKLVWRKELRTAR